MTFISSLSSSLSMLQGLIYIVTFLMLIVSYKQSQHKKVNKKEKVNTNNVKLFKKKETFEPSLDTISESVQEKDQESAQEKEEVNRSTPIVFETLEDVQFYNSILKYEGDQSREPHHMAFNIYSDVTEETRILVRKLLWEIAYHRGVCANVVQQMGVIERDDWLLNCDLHILQQLFDWIVKMDSVVKDKTLKENVNEYVKKFQFYKQTLRDARKFNNIDNMRVFGFCNFNEKEVVVLREAVMTKERFQQLELTSIDNYPLWSEVMKTVTTA